jgi:hypothetical protein
MTTPRMSKLAGLSPGERQRMLAEARRKRDEQRDVGLHTGLRRSLLQAAANNMAMLVAEKKEVYRANEEGTIPVRLGDIRRGGNIFHIIAAVQQGIQWAESRRAVEPTPAQLEVVHGFMHRKYEETLDMIVEHFHDVDGSIAAYRLHRYGDPVAPTRHDAADATFATPGTKS